MVTKIKIEVLKYDNLKIQECRICAYYINTRNVCKQQKILSVCPCKNYKTDLDQQSATSIIKYEYQVRSSYQFEFSYIHWTTQSNYWNKNLIFCNRSSIEMFFEQLFNVFKLVVSEWGYLMTSLWHAFRKKFRVRNLRTWSHHSARAVTLHLHTVSGHQTL